MKNYFYTWKFAIFYLTYMKLQQREYLYALHYIFCYITCILR